ncbi:septum formation initiator family protein [Candidatus Falkowbacteria bacterium]|nr:septum formation initiator family protein [Candidatus Falkowbacteria bacterium]
MWENKRKKSIFPDLLFSKFFLIFCVVIFLAVLFYLAKGTIRTYKINTEITDLEREISHLENQNEGLAQLINYLKSDTFIEQEAKLKLGLKKPGENLVVIPQINEAQNNSDKIVEEQKNPAKWWAYFFNNNQ